MGEKCEINGMGRELRIIYLTTFEHRACIAACYEETSRELVTYAQ